MHYAFSVASPTCYKIAFLVFYCSQTLNFTVFYIFKSKCANFELSSLFLHQIYMLAPNGKMC